MTLNRRLKKLEQDKFSKRDDPTIFITIYDNHPDGPRTLEIQTVRIHGGLTMSDAESVRLTRPDFDTDTAFMDAVNAAYLEAKGIAFDWGDDAIFYNKETTSGK